MGLTVDSRIQKILIAENRSWAQGPKFSYKGKFQMKKILVSALAALAMVIGGFSAPAQAVAPTVTAVAGPNPGEIVVSWTPVGGETYKLWYCGTTTNYCNPDTLIDPVTSPYTLTNLPAGTDMQPVTYRFTWRSYVSGVAQSVVDLLGGVQPAVAVGVPTGISGQAQGQLGDMYVSWNVASNATGYKVYYSTTDLPLNDAGWTSAGTSSWGSKTLTGLSTSSTYYIKIVPTRAGSDYTGAKSSSAFAPSAGPQPLAAPTGLNVTTPLSGRIQVSWNSVSQAFGGYKIYVGATQSGAWIQAATTFATAMTLSGYNPSSSWWVKVVAVDNMSTEGAAAISTSAITPNGGAQVTPPGQTVVTNVLPVVPVFKQPKFSMPSKIDVDTTGKVSLSGKDMGVSTVLIGGKEQKIDTNSDEKLVFDTTGLAKGVHDLVMKGAFGTYTIQKAIQVGEPVVTKVAAVSARQVGMAGGELSISGVGLEGTTQITMNGQVLEILSKTDSKVTFKIPASTVASVNSIMIEGSFVPVLFKNAFSYTK